MDADMAPGLRAECFSEDFIGSLLPLLSTIDVKSFLLTCKAFNTAAKRQIRFLSPLCLWHSTTTWDSLEYLQLSHSRSSNSNHDGNNAYACPFAYEAPIRQFGGIKGFRHAAHVDLSGQVLPAEALLVLSGHLTRLKTLKLDTCQLPKKSMLNVSGLTTLQSLSISGLKLNGSLSAPPAVPAGRSASARRVAGSSVAGGDASTSSSNSQEPAADPAATADTAHRTSETKAQSVQELQWSRLLDAICQLQQLQELRMDMTASSETYVRRTYGIPLLHHASKLSALTNLTALSILGNAVDSSDWEALCGGVGPQLKEFHCSWGTTDRRGPADQNLDHASFSSISKMASLACLTLEVPKLPCFEPYTLAPLAATLTELKLSGPASIQLVLSLIECSRVVRLELSGLRAAALNELLVQVVSSMPSLQRLRISKLHPPLEQLQPPADYLLSQLDSCCPQLTELRMPDVELNGTGLRLVSSAAAAAGSIGGLSAPGGVRSCRHSEICATHMMRSAFPHLSALTGLQSLVLYGMGQKKFPHLCKLNCLQSLSALTNLTSLRILPVLDELARYHIQLQAQYAAAAAAAAQQPAAAGPAAAAAAGGAAGGGEAMLLDDNSDADADDDVDADDGDMDSDDAVGSDDEEGEEDLIADDGDSEDEQQQSDDESMSEDQEISEDAEIEDDVDEAQLHNAQQAANQAVQALAQVMQNQADILANNPAQQVLAGGAFQQVAHMILPQPGNVHFQGPGGAAAAAAVAAVHAAAAQLAQGAAPAPEGAGAVAAVQNALQAAVAAAGGGQQQQQQAPVIPYAGMYGLRHHPFEPHLHFLGSMTGLVNLELCCLQTTGLCFLHLSNLQSLQSLALGGKITLDDSSWAWMAQLQLPGVTCLSFTGCTVATASSTAAAAAAASATAGVAASGTQVRSGEAKASSSSSRENSESTDPSAGIDGLVQALCHSFHGVVNLELGSCRFMTTYGLKRLAIGMQKLERLRLLGVPDLALYISKEPRKDPRIQSYNDGCDHSVAGASIISSSTLPNQQVAASRCYARTVQLQVERSGHVPQPQLERDYKETKFAIGRLSALAHSGIGAVDLKYVEVCVSEAPHGVMAAADGLQNVARLQGANVSYVRHEGNLVSC